MRLRLLAAMGCVFGAAFGAAEIVAEPIPYDHDGAPMEGFVVYDSSLEGPLPTVLIVHDWDGIGDYERARANQLAEMGYLAFAVDVFGAGVRPDTVDARRAEIGKYYADPELFRGRLAAGLEAARGLEWSADDQIAAIGYCFGGSAVLEMARAGMDVDGIVSFHGSLSTQMPATQAGPKVLLIHAVNDPVADRNSFNAFLDEFSSAGFDFQVVVYNLTAHSFTVPGSPDYNADADRRSWEALDEFLEELFGDDED